MTRKKQNHSREAKPKPSKTNGEQSITEDQKDIPNLEKNMTREEILTAIREVAEKLEHPPTFPQLEDMTAMRRRDIRKHFRSFTGALEESGVGVGDNCRRIPDEALFEEWATIARKLKKLPSITQFDDRSKYTVAPYQGRFRHWSRVPEKMGEYARTHGLMDEWQDVMELIRRKDEEGLAATADGRPRIALREPEIRKDRPIYGPLMAPAPLLHEPINEMGVVFLFGTQAARLGYMVTLIQAGFPDCEAFRVVAERRLQRVKIEFEQESRNFLKHGHNVNDCDMIVCWEHNWPECPLEVLELRTLLSGEKTPLTTKDTKKHGGRSERQEPTTD